MTDVEKFEEISISALQDLPVKAKNISSTLVKIISKTAKSNPREIQPILVGKVNSLFYPINEFETVLGLRLAGVKTLNAHMIDYPTIEALLIAHVRKNFHPQTIDPFRIIQVIDHMVKNGMKKSDVIQSLWLDKRPELRKVIELEITDKTITYFLNILDELSEKIYSVTTPIYYAIQLGQIVKEKQLNAVKELGAYVQTKMISNEVSFWPNQDTVREIFKNYPKKGTETPVKERVAKYGTVEDSAKSTDSTNASSDTKPSKEMIKNAEKFIASDPDLLYVPIEGEHPDLLVNLKTRRVAKIGDRQGAYTIVGDMGKPFFVIPPHTIQHLDPDKELEKNTRKVDVSIKKYSSLEKARNALEKITNQNIRCIVITKRTSRG